MVSSDDLATMMTASVDDYNNYNSKDVAKWVKLKKNSDYRYAFAREYSPAIYAKDFKNWKQVRDFLFEAKDKLDGDEVSFIVDGEYIWPHPEDVERLEQRGRTQRKLSDLSDEEIMTGQARVWWD
jgi:hypothetical protein